MNQEEILALLPKEQPVPLDKDFYQGLTNHWSHWGAESLVHKLGRGWVVEYRGHGHPVIFKTKREAVDMASRWVLAIQKHIRA